MATEAASPMEPFADEPSFPWLIGFCLPLSYGVKLAWGLSAPFVEPAFLAILVHHLAGHRFPRIRWPEWALLACYLASTVLAIRHPEVLSRWGDAFSHTGRFAALVLLLAWARDLTPRELAPLGKGLVAAALVQLALSVTIAATAIGVLPNFLMLDLGYLDYESRFTLVTGSLRIPRLIGTFPEPAPFGAFGVAALVILYRCAQWLPERTRWVGYVSAILIVATSVSDQAILGFAVVMGYLGLARRRGGLTLVTLKTATVVLVLLIGIYEMDRLLEKGAELEEIVSLESVWGSSGAERIINSIMAWNVFSEDCANILFGVGPSLFGVFVAQFTSLLPETHQVQVLPFDILVSIGLVGFLAFMTVGASWVATVTAPGGRWFLLALLVASTFQSDFKGPALAVAIGLCLGLSGRADEVGKAMPATGDLPAGPAAEPVGVRS
jgi:hypothetical protein